MVKLVIMTSIVMAMAILSDFFSKKNSLLNGYLHKEKLMWILIVAAMSIFAGLRLKYNDTTVYIESYKYRVEGTLNVTDLKWTFGINPGFNYVQAVLKHFDVSAHGYILVFAIFTYFVYIWFIRKYSSDFTMSMLLFMCMVFTFPLAGIKQAAAVAFCLIAVDMAVNKKWIWFLIFVFIAELFHAYSFLYLIVPLLFFIPWRGRKSYYFISIFVVMGFLLRPLLNTLVSITQSLGDDYTLESFSGAGVNPLRVLVCFVPLVLSYFLKGKITDSEQFLTIEEGLFLNLSFLNGLMMFIALFGTANYFARLANYFYIFPIIILPRLFNMIESRYRIPLKAVAIVSYLFFFWYSNVIAGVRPFDDAYEMIKASDFYFFDK